MHPVAARAVVDGVQGDVTSVYFNSVRDSVGSCTTGTRSHLQESRLCPAIWDMKVLLPEPVMPMTGMNTSPTLGFK